MSHLIRHIFQNRSTRILVYFYLIIIALGVFFVVSNYYSQKEFIEKCTYAQLKPIAKMAASQVDVYRLKSLLEEYPNKDDIAFYDQNDNYLKLHYDLKHVYDLEEVKSPIYILVYDEKSDVFRYVVRSDRKVFYLHEYRNYPKLLKELMETKQGGTLPLYMSDKGEWLSAIEPILDNQGTLIGIVEVDENDKVYFDKLRRTFVREFIFIAIGIILIALIMLPMVKKILREEKKQLEEITHQRDTIEEFSNEVQASVRYASELQGAMLPDAISEEVFKNAVVVNQPRDIVSGDFRWYKETDKYCYVSVADCTGHGVPGAMLSMIGSTILNGYMSNSKDPTPAELLSELDKQFTSTINSNTTSGRPDGMDIAMMRMCKEHTEVLFAGALSDLHYLQDGEMHRIKGDRYPVGGGNFYRKEAGYVDHELDVHNASHFFLFSDGFQDQFGGEKGKKLGRKRWVEILKSACDVPHTRRATEIEKRIRQYQGEHLQVDDRLLVMWEMGK